MSISDEILADREETIESLHQQVKKLEKRTRELSSELDAAQEDARRADAKWKEAEERSRRFKGQSHDNITLCFTPGVTEYIEYHRVSPSFVLGRPTPSPATFPPPGTKGGEYTLACVRGGWESQFGRLERKLSTLSTLRQKS